MTFTEKAQELIKGHSIVCAKVMGFDACIRCRVISQMREDLQAFKEFAEKNITILNFGPTYYIRIEETYIKKVEDISQALKVLDGEKT